MCPVDSVEEVKELFAVRGRKGYEAAKEAILKERYQYKPVYETLKYFMEELWLNFQHPALLSLACEAVGGDPESTVPMGGSLVLLTGAADVHDDIIDQSETKAGKQTVLGKFGRDMALLVGDALLIKGYSLLSEACESLPRKKRSTIAGLVREAFFEIGNAEAEEASLRGKWDVDPEQCFNIMERKAAIAEATARIGAILGNGSPEEVEAVGRCGRILAILGNVRNEFVDTFEPEELINRVDNECLPLPVLYALRNKAGNERVVSLLRKGEIDEKDAFEIAHAVRETKEVQGLRDRMNTLVNEGLDRIRMVNDQKAYEIWNLMITTAIKDL